MLKPLINTFVEILFFAILLTGVFTSLQAQTPQNLIRQGNQKYSNAEFGLAEIDYRKSLEKNNPKTTHTASFNLGDALYKQGRYEEAATQFEQIGKTGNDNNLKSNAFYNMGNALLKAKKIPESIEAYKNALRLNPNNADAKYNLAYARKLKEQEQEQQQQDKQQQNQEQDQDKEQQEQKEEQDKQEQQQNQQQQNQEQQQQQQQDKQQQEGQEGKEGEQQDQQQAAQMNGQERKLSKEETVRLLEALKNEELKVQQKLKQRQGKANKTQVDKDW